jgi:Collagen triple helix repeat (20 copies)
MQLRPRTNQPTGKVRRSRVTYANVTATLALVAAIGGGTAWATTSAHARSRPRSHARKHYTITSTSQIKPSVLKALKGTRGKAGAAGASGTPGAAGTPGTSGATGPAGASGAPGGAGTNGTNGAVAGFVASHSSAIDFTSGTASSPTTIMTKNLPAGNFLVSAKTALVATTTTNPTAGSYVNDSCALTDGSVTDQAVWDTSFSNESLLGTFSATDTVPLAISVSSGNSNTVTLGCWLESSAGTALDTEAELSQIQAVQVSTIG